MTTRFRTAPGATERVACGCSPLVEAVLSLHVLTEPHHHPVQHPWVRRARGLSAKLRREIKAFAFSYRNDFPRFLLPGPAAEGPLRSFEAELQALALVPPALAALELTRPLHPGQITLDSAALCPTDRVAIEAAAGALDEDSAELVQLALEAPGQAMERFQLLLADYWAGGFDAEWERIGPRLAKDASQIADGVAARGLCGILEDLRSKHLRSGIRVDPAKGMLWLDDAHEHDVDIGEAGLLLVPSLYAWPHVHVNCDDPWPLGLIVPSPSVIRDAQPVIPPREVVLALRALADDTRLRALQFIAERPRSTQELAPLVRLSEAAMSNHLRILAAAGIIRARREGYYVLYGLSQDRLAAVWPLLAAYLRAG